MNSPLVIYFVLKIQLLGLFTSATKRSSGVSKIVKKLGKHGHAFIPTEATGFPMGSAATWQVGRFRPIIVSSNNYTEHNLSRWKCSPGVLVRTSPGQNVLQKEDIIPSFSFNTSMCYRATLAMQGTVVYLHQREK